MNIGRRATAGVLAVLALSTLSYAQSLEEKLEKKLAKPFVSNAAWELDYETALKKAKDSNKVVFAYFTRSYSP